MNSMHVNRRTALKIAGGGLVGSTVAPGIVSAQENATFDGTFHLLEGKFPGEPNFPNGRSETKDPDSGYVIGLLGSGIFAQSGDAVNGGGSFRVQDSSGHVVSDGVWTADEVVEWDPYGNEDSPWPDAWKGGFLELETSFYPITTGIAPDDTLNISCHVGLSSEDEPHFDSQGIRIGSYTEVQFPFTLFHYTERKEESS